MLSGPFFKRERTSESGIVSIQYLSELLNNESEADRSGSALESTEQEVQEQNQGTRKATDLQPWQEKILLQRVWRLKDL